MTNLIEKLETATEGSRKLDEKIAFQLQWRPETVASKASFASHERKHDYVTAWIAHAPWRADWPIPSYTTSLDAAMTLIPFDAEGHRMCTLLECYSDGTGNASVIPFVGEQVWSRKVATPVLALCIAALKAREKT